MASVGYALRWLKVIYIARQAKHLRVTLERLHDTLRESSLQLPIPYRLPRRQWRVTYLKSPFKHKHAIRHYVFNDFRYSVVFNNVEYPQPYISVILAAMDEETACTCHFAWHSPGKGEATKNLKAFHEHFSSNDKIPAHQMISPFPNVYPLHTVKQNIAEEQAIARISSKLEKQNLHWFVNKHKFVHV